MFWVILCALLVFIALYFLYKMPNDFLKQFEEECHKAIMRRDEEYKER